MDIGISDVTSPCTLAETVRISRSMAEDVLLTYDHEQASYRLSAYTQLDILKEVLISSGLMTEADFRKRFEEKLQEYQQMAIKENSPTSPVMSAHSNEIEVVKE